MYPTITCPESPNLVSALMEDRMGEAAAARLAATVRRSEFDTPHRFRRFIARVALRPTPGRRLSPASRHE